MHACPKNLGFMLNEHPRVARDQTRTIESRANRKGAPVLCWPILKGDLILSDRLLVVEKEYHTRFVENGGKKFKLDIYEYDYDDEVPTTMKHPDGEQISI